METLQLLGVALGLASMAGINLYLTVFVTGLAVQQQWVILAPQYQQLAVLAHPAIIITAGVLYFIEFFADKIPWVDSMWDTVHTLIRPVGGAMLALRALGSTDPQFEVLIALLAGGVSFMTHSVKASTRLVANTSPEPFSNIALSVVEDLGVLGGLALIYQNPLIALGVLAVFCAGVVYLGPKLYRAFKAKVWLISRKLNFPAGEAVDEELPKSLPSDYEAAWGRWNLMNERIEWAVPCLSGPSRQIGSNRFGYLIATVEEPLQLHFVGKRGWSKNAETLDLVNHTVNCEPKFLSVNVVLNSSGGTGSPFVFLFDRTQARLAEKVTHSLEERLAIRNIPSPPADAESRVEAAVAA